MKSWKTTMGGLALAIGGGMTTAWMFGAVPQLVGAIGAGLSAFAGAWLGFVARDNGVTSKQAGAE